MTDDRNERLLAPAAGIYIHVPFCKKKCLYCDFPSYAGCESLYETYKNALCNEILQYQEIKKYEITTIFIGGGTPTVLPPLFLSEIMAAISNYTIATNAEVTVEANPGSLGKEMLPVLRQAGVNRLSIGLQAWQDEYLVKIGRIHKLGDFLQSYNAAVQAGFANINVDLMFSLPGQSIEDWRQTLEQVILLDPAHISAYGLTIEDETPFGRQLREGTLTLPSEQTDRAMYAITKDMLTAAGYEHYEISNFAKHNLYARHNINYWECGPYLGFGLGAHSFANGLRFHNTYELEGYLASSSDKNAITKEITPVTREDAMAEMMFLGLRMLAGVRLADFHERFGVNIFSVYGDAIRKLVAQNLLIIQNGRMRLTDLGIDVSNTVFCEFIKLS